MTLTEIVKNIAGHLLRMKEGPTATSGFGSSKASRRRAHCHQPLTPERTPPLLLGEFGEIPVKSITIWPISSSPRIACQNRVRRRAPPTVHNEQSSCRDIVSLWAWSHLPGASGLAPLRSDSTWRVALPITSNPTSVQNGQRSSPHLHAFRSQRSAAEVSQCGRIAAPRVNTKTIHGDPRLSRLPSASHRLVGRSLAFVTECNRLCQ
jgi:hypothetical protein